MKNVVITRHSSLFRLVAFLSEIPLYSSFIKEHSSYNHEKEDWDTSYNTFNDVCTFCRHFILAILTSFFYAFLFVIILNCLIIQPFIVLFGGVSVQGSITLGFLALIGVLYFITLLLQKIMEAFQNRKKDTSPSVEEEREDGLILKTYNILSQKHHDFCKRLEVKDE
jgi:hypothetical protein